MFSLSVRSDSFAAPWTVACQAPGSMGFSRQECWSGLPFPLPGDLPDPGIKPSFPLSPELQADSLPSEHACSVVSVVPDSVRPHGLSPRGSSVHGILQARMLEWVATYIIKKKKILRGVFLRTRIMIYVLFKNSCKTKPLFQGARKFASISVSLQKSITHRPVSASRCASGKSLSVCKREHD